MDVTERRLTPPIKKIKCPHEEDISNTLTISIDILNQLLVFQRGGVNLLSRKIYLKCARARLCFSRRE